MTTTHRFCRAPLLAVGLVAMLAGCTTTQMNAEWRDPAFTDATLVGKRVVVVCRAPEEATRRVCEDQLADQLGAQQVAVVRSYSIAGFPWASGDTSDQMNAAVRASGVAALASMSLFPGDVIAVNPGPEVGVGIGGGRGGGYRGGGFGFGGIGISFPIGGAQPTQSLGASSSVVDAASGKLIWSGSASTPTSSDTRAQVGALAQIMIDAMRKARLI